MIIPVKIAPAIVTNRDVERNATKFLNLVGAKETGENQWRGICPICAEETLSLRWTGQTLLFTCHHKEEHRDELIEWQKDQGIYLSEYFAVPVVEQILAEFPFFRIDRKKNTEIIESDFGNGIKIRLVPSVLGHPTVYDEPLFLFAVRLAKSEFDAGGGVQVPKWVSFKVVDCLTWSGRRDEEITGYRSRMVEGALERMSGLRIVTTIEWGEHGKIVEGTGLIYDYKFGQRHKLAPGVVSISLPEWTCSQIASNKMIHLTPDYFSYPPFIRRVYQVLHKHLGRQKEFVIGVEKLKQKVGFGRETKKFRHELRTNSNIVDINLTILPDDKILAKRQGIHTP